MTDEQIQSWCYQAMSQLVNHKEEVLCRLKVFIDKLEQDTSVERECDDLEKKLTHIREEVEQLVSQNAIVAQNQTVYTASYNELVDRYQQLQEKYINAQRALEEHRTKIRELTAFLNILQQQEMICPLFDHKLFYTLVDRIVIYKENKVDVHFRNGQVVSL